jgi:hypothetical protein|tara:strand:+ start:445 stop:729 length:285 start_codon:yes stop_codon:yes gene_type:complete
VWQKRKFNEILLVKHSNFVLSMCSTSVNFPVVYKKPIVFLSINPTKSTFNDSLTASMAKKLGKSPIPMTGMMGLIGSRHWLLKKIVITSTRKRT